MKALLINPYVPLEVVYGSAFAEAGAVLPPLGILYIASYLGKAGRHKVEVLDANALKMGPAAVAEAVLSGGLGCAGLSATTLAYPYAVEIAEALRKARPGIRLVLGGAHAQAAHREILAAHPGLFDYVCHAEGEYSFGSLLDFLDGAAPEEQISGFSYLKNGGPVTTPARPVPDDLDVFGHPAKHIPAECVKFYREKIFACRNQPVFSIISARGCPFKCSFCSAPAKFSGLYRGKMRHHSVQWICREMELLRDRHGVKEIMFADDTFNLSRERVTAFCEAAAARGLSLPWTCNFEAAITDLEMLRLMKRAGCWGIMIGAESGSDRVLEFIKKGVTAAQLKKAGQLAAEAGLVSRASFILGLPTETEETVEETLAFLRDAPFDFPYFQLYMPLPDTGLYGLLERHGRVIRRDPAKRSASRVNYVPAGLNEEYLLRTFRKLNRHAYFRTKMVKRHLKSVRSFADLKRYWKGFRLMLRM